MERLTERRADGRVHMNCNGCEIQTDCGLWGCRQRMMNRLASYEDSEMLPEKVAFMKELIEMAFAEDTSRVEHLRELDKADKAGCIVVLPPCKYGDTLYCLENGKIYPKTITQIAFYLQDTLRTIIISAKNYRGETNGFLASELGKTMFLSLEEAERALEEQKNV